MSLIRLRFEAFRQDYETFCESFRSERDCAEALFRSRWPDGFRCPGCLHPHYYLIQTRRLPLYECSSCSRQTSVIAGTIMEGSRTSLTRWFQALFLLSLPDGMSATRIAEMIRVTYKTAWLMAHKIRHAMMQADESESLSGTVKVEKTDYGSFYFRDAKQPLVIGGSLNTSGNLLHVKIKQPVPADVNNESRHILRSGFDAFIRSHVSPNSDIQFQRPGAVRHPGFSQIRMKMNQWLNDTFNGIGAKHLQAYLNEFCFRVNANLRDAPAFLLLLRWCSHSPVLLYKKLIESRPVLPVPWLVFPSKGKWKGHHLSLWNA